MLCRPSRGGAGACSQPAIDGGIFIGAIAAYTLFRRVVLLPLRVEPRKTSAGRWLTMIVATLVLIGDVVLLTLHV